MSPARRHYLLGVAVALFAALFLLFGIGALGIIGAGGRPDLMYVAALGIGVLGAVLARFRARGMSVAMGATSLATLLVGVVAIAAGLHRNEGASALEILGLSGMYAALFGVSAWFLLRAAGPSRSDSARSLQP